MANMADPYTGLISFQKALQQGLIEPTTCVLHPELVLLLDNADGQQRLTYALIENETVKATAVYILVEPYEKAHCFQVGYAVAEPFRRQGIAAEILEKSIAEMRNGFKQHIPGFYIEGVVSVDNLASRKIAERFISSAPEEIKDDATGEPALQYFRYIE